MHKKVYSGLLLATCWLSALSGRAQDTVAIKKHVDMADRFQADGKIYVVITVVLTILLGLIAYVMRLDSKIRRFEKSSK